MNCYLIGIGGVGMSALATLLIKQGHRVSGSDRNVEAPSISSLRRKGAEIFPESSAKINPQTDVVVYSTAIEHTHPILNYALKNNIKTVHRAKALSDALSSKKIIAVAGTCGKSSVTALLGHILIENGFRPLCVNGAEVPGWEGAVYFGNGQ